MSLRVLQDEGGWLIPQPDELKAHGRICVPRDGRWMFNGDYERPTFSPSVRETWRVPPANEGDPPGPEQTNHVIITDGKIHYCGDCTHALAGKSVEIPPIPEHLINEYYWGRCPACQAERADWEGPDGAHLPTCPNCGSEADPLAVPVYP